MKLKKSIKIFKENNVNVRSFFAPNHTYDLNTFKALKANGIFNVIDGYGLFPYNKYGINFIPQLFFKNIILPFGIQSTQIHVNYWNIKKYKDFETFIEKNHRKIINYNFALSKINNNLGNLILRLFSEYLLKFYRFVRVKF